MAYQPKTLEEALKVIEDLEAKLAAAVPKITDREKKIRERMTKGRISYAAAEMAVDHQAVEDKSRADDAKKTAKK